MEKTRLPFAFLLAFLLSTPAMAQTRTIQLHPSRAGDLDFLEPHGWHSKHATDSNGITLLTLAAEDDTAYSLIVSTNLVATPPSPRSELDAMTTRSAAQNVSLLWQSDDTAAAEFSLPARNGRILYATAVCTQNREGNGYRQACGMGISPVAEIARTFLPARQVHAVLRSIQGHPREARAPQPAAAPLQAPAPTSPPRLTGAWSTSRSSPSFERYLRNGKVEIGGSGETLYLELGPKRTYRFVTLFRTTGPYFPGFSILDDRGVFTVADGVYSFRRKRCLRTTRTGHDPMEKEGCGKDEGLSTLEITTDDGGENLVIVGENLTFMGRGRERKALHRAR